MKPKAMITILAVWAMILAAPLAALGAQGQPGPPTNPGPGGGGANAGDAAGALYGDLYVIERDGNGVPLTRTVEYTYVDPETGETVTDTATCNQPLAATCFLLPLWGEQADFDPELYDPCAVFGDNTVTEFTELLQTVSFGRESVGRSPASVLDSSYAEALKSMNEATDMKQDPAGRIMLYLPVEDDPSSFFWKTIDAPLENLGMYRTVMIDGCLSPITEIVIGEEGQTIEVLVELSASAKNYLDNNVNNADLGHLICSSTLPEEKTKPDFLSSAVFIGAAADKTSPVTLDEIINMNTYLQVNPYTYDRVKKETILEIDYLDFGTFDYVFGTDACKNTTNTALLTWDNTESTFSIASVNVFGVSPPGVALRDDLTTEVVEGVAITVCRSGDPLGAVCDQAGIEGCGGANWFAQAAEDARKTIWYLHNWRVPEIAY